MPVISHRFTVRAAGHRLQAEHTELVHATSEEPVLVFLHEGLGSIAQWKEFPAQLCLACSLPV